VRSCSTVSRAGSKGSTSGQIFVRKKVIGARRAERREAGELLAA
jgi:hypothetical protein